MKEKVVVSWSGGKDCALALFEVLKTGKYEVLGLMTNVEEDGRARMQGVRSSLLKKQAAALGLPLEMVSLPMRASNEEYERKTEQVLKPYREQGAAAVVFGDLFLEEIKDYRDRLLRRWGFKGLYPIWKRPTQAAARQMIKEGFHAVVSCVDTTQLDKSFAGRAFDLRFLEELPAGVDACGENGEFHTFVFDGPFFKEEVKIKAGDCFLKDNRFHYCDLLSEEDEDARCIIDRQQH